jgi:tRNA(Ile)-lysidine synthase
MFVAEVVSVEEFHSLMMRFVPPLPGGRFALAVSGGPDSMALAALAKQWCESHKLPLPKALIVDHALRSESADEAVEVQQRLEKLGLEAAILRWEHAPLTSRMHSEARKARYRLLVEACRKDGFACLLVAHQREDQAETVLMRFAKGTGIDGLAGIPACGVIDGVRILRPLLSVPKARLVAVCEAARVSYVTDPSNEKAIFARGRLRRVLPLLEEEGLTVDRLVDFAVRAGEAREALDYYTSGFLKEFCEVSAYGAVSFVTEGLLKIPRAVALRALSRALQFVHAEDYPPQHASLSYVFDALAGTEMPMRTLHGCTITQNQKQILIAREFAAIMEETKIRSGETVVWDGRWQVALAAATGVETYTVKALGNPPHDELDRLSPRLRACVPQGRVRSGLPAIWSDNKIVFVPFFCPQEIAQASLLSTI